MLNAQLIQEHLRLDEDEHAAQSALLRAYSRAAWRLVETHTGRELVDVGDWEGKTAAELHALLPEGSPENAAALDGDLVLAQLLLIAHWYQSREAASDVPQSKRPLAVDALIGPYRWYTL